VIVKVFVDPAQLTAPFVKVGVTTIVPLIGELPVFVPVKDGISPLPLAPKPIEVFELVQVYVVVPPVFVEVNVTAVELAVLQIT
jgi:hypothetical protein